MGLMDVAKEAYAKVSGQEIPQGDTRPISSTVSNAKVVLWHYVIQNFGSSSGVDLVEGQSLEFGRTAFEGMTTGAGTVLKAAKKKNYLPSAPASDEDVFKVEKIVLDAEIVDIQTSKSIGSPSGSFKISLLASDNWKRKIAPGDWLAIYLLQDSSFDPNNLDSINMVMVGSVDRIAKTKQRDEETDKVLVRYVINGRDFGKALEDVVAWFNPYAQSKEVVQLLLTTAGRSFAGNPSSIVRETFNLFFGEQGLGQYNLAKNVSDNVKQALVPAEIEDLFNNRYNIPTLIDIQNEEQKYAPPGMSALKSLVSNDFSGGTLFSKLIRLNIDDGLPGYKPVATLGQSMAGTSVWSLLKKESNSLVNDLYVDLFRDEDGYAVPTLTLAPHPCSNFFQDTPGALNDTFLKMNDLDEISISNSRIKYEDLGRDDNSRINMIWLEARQGISKMIQTAAYIGTTETNGIGLPMYQRESIMRHGLKVWDQMLENAYSGGGGDYDDVASAAKAVQSGFNGVNIAVDLYKSFINQIYDLNIYNHLYETGSIVTTGNSSAQLGVCLRIRSDFNDDDRLYFVEGYTHTWTYPNQWETEWNLTHGQFDNKARPFIDSDESDGGQDDNEANRRYLVKTNFKKP